MTMPRDFVDSYRRNMGKLDACAAPQHDFAFVPGADVSRRYRCAHCGGEVGPLERHWYVRGLMSGRASSSARGGVH